MDKIIAAMVALLIFPVSFSTRTGTNFFHVSHGLVFSFVTFSLMNDHPQNWMNGGPSSSFHSREKPQQYETINAENDVLVEPFLSRQLPPPVPNYHSKCVLLSATFEGHLPAMNNRRSRHQHQILHFFDTRFLKIGKSMFTIRHEIKFKLKHGQMTMT